MKTFKILVLLLAFSTVTFYSCSDSNPIENESTAQKSIALRTVLNELKAANNISGKLTNPFCFDFVYPITFSFNNGTTVTVATFEGLLDVLSNESPTTYVAGIVFPFQVTGNGAITTINTEADFTALVQSCNFDTFLDDLANTFCFDIVFPINVQLNGQVTAVNSLEELLNIGNTSASNGEVQVVFPISVIYNNDIVVVNSIYEFYEMTNNCDQGGCICTQDYAPVCVQTANGIVEFGNMCYALCAGYTQNDLVPCNNGSCDIANLQVTVGNCNSDGTYQVTVNFLYSNPDTTLFTLRRNDTSEVIGTYPVSSLPLTINNYTSSGTGTDSLQVNFGPNCQDNAYWTTPSCGVCTCPPTISPVCVYDANGLLVQYNNSCLAECAGYTANDFVNCNPSNSVFANNLGFCFNIAYPVGVQSGGAIVNVNSNAELLQYITPTGGIPPMNYPIVVTFLNPTETFTFANQAAFEAQMNSHCQ